MNSIEEIYNWLLINKNNFNSLTGLTGLSDYQTFLENLTSDSKVANWNLELYNQSVVIQLIMNKMNEEVDNINDILITQPVMVGDWYRKKILEFQYGDLIQIINYVPNYFEIDETKQIVEFCAVQESGTTVLIKVRRIDGTILSSDEEIALEEYISKIKSIGSEISVINEEPDDIKFYYDVIYDPEINLTDLKTNVENVISDYINNLVFDSKIYLNILTSALQEIDGVIDARGEKISAKKNSEVTYVDYDWEYQLYSGYGLLNDIENTITYNV